MTDESNLNAGFSMQKGLQHFNNKRFGPAVVHFNHFKNIPPLTKEMAETTATASWMAGVIHRDEYGQLEASLRDLDEARKTATKWGHSKLEARIILDLEKTSTLLAKKSRGRKK